MLTHAALVSNLLAAAKVLDVSDADVGLSFLPLSHAFERMVAWVYLLCGVHVVFAESFDTVGRDIGLVKPDDHDRRAASLREAARTHHGEGRCGIRAAAPALFRWAVAAGVREVERDASRQVSWAADRLQAGLADRLVFERVREGLGGRVRYLVSGSAPLGADVAEFFSAIGLPIVEGYGLTETAPILTVNPPDAPRVGSVGKSLPGVESAHRRRRRDPRPWAQRDVGLLQQAGSDRRRAQGRLVPHRRHRHHRRGGLPLDHRSEEGPAGDVGRQEDRAAADRGTSSSAARWSPKPSCSASAASSQRPCSCRISRRSSGG